MIKLIIEYINSRIETLEIFKDLRGLCEIIEKKEGDSSISFPAEYCDNGEYKRIEDFDFKKGIIYHRLRGETNETTVDSTVSCETNIRRTYSLRAIGIVKKNVLKKKNDDNYIDDKIGNNLSNIIAKSSVKTLQTDLKAEDVSIESAGYNTNRYEIWNQEHKNIPMSLDFEYIYIAVDYNVTVEGSKDCFDIFDCDTNLTLSETLCPTIILIDGGDSGPDSQFKEINGLLDGCNS